MDGLAAWLRQQLDEDERAAAAVADIGLDTLMPAAVIDRTGATVYFAPEVYARVCSVLDPARVLLEVEAKRRRLGLLAAMEHDQAESFPSYGDCMILFKPGELGDLDVGYCSCGLDTRRGAFYKIEALPYADRPGYRQEWAP